MTAIIFDFDGVIADTIDSVVSILHNLSKQTNRPLSEEQIKTTLRTKTLKEIIREYKISKIQLPVLVWKIRSALRKRAENAKPFPGIKQTLESLSDKFSLYLLTSNSPSYVESFLKQNSLQYFQKIYSKSSLFGKKAILKKIMSENSLPPKETIYVCDEARDIEACKGAGCLSLAVTYGYNNLVLLRNADALAHSPSEIPKKVVSLLKYNALPSLCPQPSL